MDSGHLVIWRVIIIYWYRIYCPHYSYYLAFYPLSPPSYLCTWYVVICYERDREWKSGVWMDDERGGDISNIRYRFICGYSIWKCLLLFDVDRFLFFGFQYGSHHVLGCWLHTSFHIEWINMLSICTSMESANFLRPDWNQLLAGKITKFGAYEVMGEGILDCVTSSCAYEVLCFFFVYPHNLFFCWYVAVCRPFIVCTAEGNRSFDFCVCLEVVSECMSRGIAIKMPRPRALCLYDYYFL